MAYKLTNRYIENVQFTQLRCIEIDRVVFQPRGIFYSAVVMVVTSWLMDKITENFRQISKKNRREWQNLMYTSRRVQKEQKVVENS